MLREPYKSTLRWTAAAASFIVLLAIASPHAAAQGCAMCYQTAAASAGHAREALRHGILILLLPAASLFLGICGLIYRHRTPTKSR